MENIIFLVIIGLGFYAYLLKEKKAEHERQAHAELKAQLDAAERTKVRLLERVEELRPKPIQPQQFESTTVDTTNDQKLAEAVKSLQDEIKRQLPSEANFLGVLMDISDSLRVISKHYVLQREIEIAKENPQQ